jgi:CRP-like cAMP-binding protein
LSRSKKAEMNASNGDSEGSVPPTLETKNQILLQLGDRELASIAPSLRLVELPVGKLLYEAEDDFDFVYFPNESVISVMAITENGQSTAVGMIGNEGAVGVDALMGAERSPYTVTALYGDGAHRIRTSDLVDSFNQCGPLHTAILRFTQRFMVQLSQKTLCNRLHNLDQRLAHWLLMCDDRTPHHTLNITQETLASMLGSTRASVTLAAIELQNRGLITYSRGKITIIDREAIESAACDCYGIIRQAYEED